MNESKVWVNAKHFDTSLEAQVGLIFGASILKRYLSTYTSSYETGGGGRVGGLNQPFRTKGLSLDRVNLGSATGNVIFTVQWLY